MVRMTCANAPLSHSATVAAAITSPLPPVALHQSSQTVMALADVHRITGFRNPDLVGWHDHMAQARDSKGP